MSKPTLSASQIETYQDCPRKWAFKYIEKLPQPESDSLKLGKDTHAVLEAYLKTGKPPSMFTKAGQVALLGIPYLPKPGKAEVEGHFVFEHNGINYQGYIDFEYLDPEDKTPVIGDHKTTSNLFWVKSQAELLQGVQPLVYAKNAFLKYKSDSVKLKWIYYQTTGKAKVKVQLFDFTPEQLEKGFESVDASAQKVMSAYANFNTAGDASTNLGACKKYGGCPYLSRCSQIQQKPNPLPILKTILPKRCLPMFENYQLFIDCFPIKTSPPLKLLQLSEVLDKAAKPLCEKHNVQHYRLLKFGQHVPEINLALTSYLKSQNLNSETGIITSAHTPEGQDTLNTLISNASTITRSI